MYAAWTRFLLEQWAVLTESKPQDSAERRQVTVMFSDLVGSTARSKRQRNSSASAT